MKYNPLSVPKPAAQQRSEHKLFSVKKNINPYKNKIKNISVKKKKKKRIIIIKII